MVECPYCKSKSNRSIQSFAENPYCAGCLHTRLDEASKLLGPTKIVQDGNI